MLTDAIRDYTLKTAREDAIRLARRNREPFVITQLRTDRFEARQMMGCLNNYWGERDFVREQYDKQGQVVANDLNWGVYTGDDPDAIAAHQKFQRVKEEAKRMPQLRHADAQAGEAPAVSRQAEGQTETP